MKSIKELYRIGVGPSSSHTMGPRFAADKFRKENPGAARFRVTLYGSLAATGRGHLTDVAITEALSPDPVEIIWKPGETLPEHPNGMKLESISPDGKIITSKNIYSVGGGAIKEEGRDIDSPEVYELNNMESVLDWCHREGRPLWQLVSERESSDIWDYLSRVWQTMEEAVKRGLNSEGVLPGELKLERKARSYFLKAKNSSRDFQRTGYLSAYALAVSEENAAGGTIATAPTCGSSGVIPSLLRYLKENMELSVEVILRALATAGIIGNLVKTNASISGAEVGCQGEVGTACAMASGAAAYLLGGTLHQIEYAAEMGMEHHLGLTCDPVAGLVQIPCIERNAFAADRALACGEYALLSDGRHRVTFDDIVDAMARTGRDMNTSYKETSLGGLAVLKKFFQR